jgi:hypothetical protein
MTAMTFVIYKQNPLALLFKALLHGHKDRIFFSGHLKCIGQQQRFSVFRPAWDI